MSHTMARETKDELRLVRPPSSLLCEIHSYYNSQDPFEIYYKYEYPSHVPNNGSTLRGPPLPALGHAVAGAVLAAVSNVATYPLNLIVARMQMQRLVSRWKVSGGDQVGSESRQIEEYASALDAARKIYATEGGISGLYTGVVQDTGKAVVDSFLFFLAYMFLRQRKLNPVAGISGFKKRAVHPLLDELAIGILAGAFARLFTTPLENIVTRKQTAAFDGNSGLQSPLSHPSTAEITSQIWSERGILGFWSGYGASLILTLNPSITFFMNEVLKYVLLPRYRQQEKPLAVMAFLIAAVSKAISSAVTYPVLLARTRQQANGVQFASRGEGEGGGEYGDDRATNKRPKRAAFVLPTVLMAIHAIAVTNGVGALYDGLTSDTLRGFFSHGIAVMTKDMVHSAIVQSYYVLLLIHKQHPKFKALLQRAGEHAKEFAEAAEPIANRDDAFRNATTPSPPPGDEMNELAEMVGEYVEDEAEQRRMLYHWFWERDKRIDS